MPLVLDIETIGQDPGSIPPRALEILFRSLKSPDAGEEEIAERRREMVDKFGLDPATGQIVCIGLLDVGSGREKALHGKDEPDLLRSFWEVLERARPDLFVTFNGKSFDFPYLNIRSAILDVPPSMVLPVRRFTTSPHFDVREVLSGAERFRKGSLDFYSAIFGIPSPKEHMDGSQVAEAYRQDRLEDIARYCLADCRATAALYQRLKAFYPV